MPRASKKNLTFVAVVITIISLFYTFFGCTPDLGDATVVPPDSDVTEEGYVEYYRDYYELYGKQDSNFEFGYFSAITEASQEKKYGMYESFFNSNAIDFAYPEGNEIPKNAYLFLGIQVQRDITLQDFALYFCGEQDGSLDIMFFVVDDGAIDFGGDFCTYNELPYEAERNGTGEVIYMDGKPLWVAAKDEFDNIIYDEDGNPAKISRNFENVNRKQAVVEKKVTLQKDVWTCVMVDIDQPIKRNQYLILLFENNTGEGHYDKDLTQLSFCMTNLWIRATA